MRRPGHPKQRADDYAFSHVWAAEVRTFLAGMASDPEVAEQRQMLAGSETAWAELEALAIIGKGQQAKWEQLRRERGWK